MFCKWCGMESETSDACSWCSRPFATASEAPAPPAPPAGQPTTALGGPTQTGSSNGYDDLDDDLSPFPFAGPTRPASQRPPAPATPPSRPAAPPPAQPQARNDAPPRPAVAPLFVPPSDAPPKAAKPPVFAPPAAQQAAPAAPPDATPPAAPPTAARAPEPPPRPAQPTPPPDAAPKPAPAPTFQPPALRSPGAAPAVPDRPDLQAIPIRRPGGAPLPPVVPLAKPQTPTAPPPPTFTPPPTAAPPPIVPRSTPAAAAPPPPTPTAPPPPVARSGAVPLGDLSDDSAAPSGPLQIDLPALGANDEETMPPIAATQVGRINLRPDAPTRPAAPPPPVPGITTTLPRAPGRYYCRWCGMESDTADRCSWCHRDLRNLPPVTPGLKAGVITTRPGQPGKKSVRQPVTKQDYAQPPAPSTAPAPPPSSAPAPVPPPTAPPQTPGTPQLGRFQAKPSPYYSGKVLDPISGAHYDPDTGEAEITVVSIESDEENEKREQYKQVGIYTGLLAACAVAGYFIVGAAPAWYLLIAALLNIGAGFALPLLRVVGFRYDDDDDVFLAGALFLLMGPYVGTIVYIVLAFLRGGGNPALIGVGVSSAILTFATDLGRGFSIAQCFQSMFIFTQPVVLQSAGANAAPDWTTHVCAHMMWFACLMAWFFADVFRQPDA